MKTRIFQTFLVFFFIILFIVFYKGLQKTNIYTPKDNTEKLVPSFKVKIFNSEKYINSEEIFTKDKFYLLNIWSSWCVPCRDEHPYLMDLSKQQNIEIIGLNYKDNIENAKIFLNELNNPYKKILSDKDGIISIEWGAYGVPESFLVYNNKILKKIIGPINKNLFLEIREIIK